MTETGEGRGVAGGDRLVETAMFRAVDQGPGHRHASSADAEYDAEHGAERDHSPGSELDGREPSGADASVRRRAAEATARAAEARATAAAADAKAAIALAARAAAAADAAAQAAEQADAAVRAAAAAEAREPRPAEQFPPAGPPRRGGHSGMPAGDLGNPVAETDTMHRAVVPAPRGSGRHGVAPADGAAPGADPTPGGRAARRRAAAAETTVFDAVPAPAGHDRSGYDQSEYDDATGYDATGYDDAGYDAAAGYVDAEPPGRPDEPVTELVDTEAASGPADEPTTALVGSTGRRARRAAAERAEDRDVVQDAPEDPKPGRAARRSAAGGRKRFGRTPVLAAVAVGGVLALTGIVFATTSGGSDPAPAAMVESAAPQVPVLPDAVAEEETPEENSDGSANSGDPLSDRGATFLRALREAGVPTSRGGTDEIEAADLVCGGLDDGVDEARIARALPATLPTVTRAQAADLVEVAKENYCR